MELKKKAVIFDLDGVICFTDKFHYPQSGTDGFERPVYFPALFVRRIANSGPWVTSAEKSCLNI